MNERARMRTSSDISPKLYIALPIPKPPAARKRVMLSGVTPPTEICAASEGNTERKACNEQCTHRDLIVGESINE